jgi:diaminohydroxyphosphoribosylaminopyrimidine deaminase/5-amino-6-(5-phosphoribosylamino)uracil reductase
VPDPIPHLRRALALASRGRYRVAPNPRVGAVVVRHDGIPDGEVVGEGFHARAGAPHAERVALDAAGERARGATLYVTLEPCAHQGRTPPCTEAVLEAGIARVVACHRDPNPEVDGGGFERLREAGVEVEHGWLVEEAVCLNLAFLTAAVHRRPAVTLKWAMSLDGKIATATGESRWISSPEARRGSLDLREEHDAILVGSNTVLADDPRLTRRPLAGDERSEPGEGGTARAPDPNVRVILDRRLRLSPTARLFEEDGPVLIYTRGAGPGGSPPEPDLQRAARQRALESRGAEVVALPDQATAPAAVLTDLWRRGIRSVLVEGGGEIHSAFVAADLYDRVLVDVGPVLVGGWAAPGPLGGEGFTELARAPRLESLEVRRRGEDVLIEGFRPGCLQTLCSKVAG